MRSTCTDHRADHTVLAGCVTPLKNNQQRMMVVRKEDILKLAQLFELLLDLLLELVSLWKRLWRCSLIITQLELVIG